MTSIYCAGKWCTAFFFASVRFRKLRVPFLNRLLDVNLDVNLCKKDSFISLFLFSCFQLRFYHVHFTYPSYKHSNWWHHRL